MRNKWHAIDLYKQVYLASEKIYLPPKDDSPITHIRCHRSNDYQKKYVEIGVRSDSIVKFNQMLERCGELKEMVKPPNSATPQYGNAPFIMTIDRKIGTNKDKYAQQMWNVRNFIELAKGLTPIHQNVIDDMEQTLNEKIPTRPPKMPSPQELYNREVTGKFTNRVTSLNEHKQQRFL